MNMKILTPSGFQKFDGVARYWHEQSLKFIFNDLSEVQSAFDHKFIVNGKEVFAKDIKVGMDIGKVVDDIIIISEGDYFYDPINVDNGNIYSHDNILVSHNTFHGTGNTLIAPEILLKLQAIEPIGRVDNLRIYKEPEELHEYMIFVDVAKGRGQDYSVFNIIDMSVRPFEQVAVYQDNTISPLLLPDVIYKYANKYNYAYVIVENNDQGSVVCNGLYYDLEYENVFVESAVKANSIGVTMTRKVKRIGCSNMKDLIEQQKLVINDAETILELSTFEARGNSFEASPGNHDDIVMSLVLFGWFSTNAFFAELTDIDMKSLLYSERIKAMEEEIVPVGFFDDGREDKYEKDSNGTVWETIDTGIF